KMVKGMGSAMDLVNSAKLVIVVLYHVNKHVESKVNKECMLLLTWKAVVNRLIKDLAIFNLTEHGMVLLVTMEDATVHDIMEKTEADFTVNPELAEVK